MTKLELVGIDKTYGKVHVLDQVSLKVEKGEFFVILGPSGCGKSTLLRILAGIETPDSGRVLIDGKDETEFTPNKRNISMVFQNYALYPNMDVRGNIAFPLKMRHTSSQETEQRVTEAAKKLNIYEVIDKPVTKISGGQKQRVALARAMVRDPALFLLDEPLSNLDARTRFMARGELKKLQQDLGQTFIFVTHDQKEAASLATSVGVLHSGKFEQVGPFDAMYEHPRTKWVGSFLGEFPMNFLPSELLGKGEGSEVGFYPEWVTIGEKGTECTVDSLEKVGDVYYLYCSTAQGQKVIVKSESRVAIGEKVAFSVDRYNSYKDGVLVSDTRGEPSSSGVGQAREGRGEAPEESARGQPGATQA